MANTIAIVTLNPLPKKNGTVRKQELDPLNIKSLRFHSMTLRNRRLKETPE